MRASSSLILVIAVFVKDFRVLRRRVPGIVIPWNAQTLHVGVGAVEIRGLLAWIAVRDFWLGAITGH